MSRRVGWGREVEVGGDVGVCFWVGDFEEDYGGFLRPIGVLGSDVELDLDPIGII